MPTEATLECTWPIQSWVQAGFKMSAWADPGRKSTMWTKQRLLVNVCRTSRSEILSRTLTKAPSKNMGFWAQCSSTPDHFIILLETETHILGIKKQCKQIIKKKKERKRSKYKTKFKTDGKSVMQSASILLPWWLSSASHFLFPFAGLWRLFLEVLS